MSYDPYIVGLTGGIGSGKSTIAQRFRELGVEVVDADQASRKVVEPGMPALNIIADRFGAEMIKNDGTLNRAAMRQLIFSQPLEKTWLENLLHPLIAEWIIDRLQRAESAYVMLESPLLLETEQHQLVNTLLLVDLPESLQLSRTAERDGDPKQQIQSIIDSQMARDDKLRRADYVFDNSLALDTVTPRIAMLHETFFHLALESLHDD
ncbi:dephospho-CoA kinase [Porticoccaceae bacterium]|nr:dephospho-CoA kinase [Porticoccaceae bacterium]